MKKKNIYSFVLLFAFSCNSSVTHASLVDTLKVVGVALSIASGSSVLDLGRPNKNGCPSLGSDLDWVFHKDSICFDPDSFLSTSISLELNPSAPVISYFDDLTEGVFTTLKVCKDENCIAHESYDVKEYL